MDFSNILETDKAYLAGFFDGEGNIHVHTHTNKAGYNSYSIRIGVSSTSIGCIETLHTKWAIGKIYYKKKTQKAHHKPSIHWLIYGLEAQAVLRILCPYPDIKRERAALALNFTLVGRGYHASDNDRANTREIRDRMIELNRKGIDMSTVVLH